MDAPAGTLRLCVYSNTIYIGTVYTLAIQLQFKSCIIRTENIVKGIQEANGSGTFLPPRGHYLDEVDHASIFLLQLSRSFTVELV